MLKWDFLDLKKFGINLHCVTLDTVTLDDPNSLFQPKQFCVSVYF